MGGGIAQGSGGGTDPAFASAPVNPMNLPTSAIGPMGGMTAPAAIQTPSTFSTIANRTGQVANALQPLVNAIPGIQTQGPDRTQQQQRRYPVNFNSSPAPYIPPPGAGSNNNYGY